MEDTQTYFLTLLTVFAILYIWKWRSNPLNSIPTVGGPSAPILSYISTYNFIRNAHDLVLEGYRKYYGSAFKVAIIDQWLVIVSGPTMVEDIRKRPMDEVSFVEASDEIFNIRHTLGRSWLEDPYHVHVVRERLTHTLPEYLPDVLDELMLAVSDHIPAQHDWLPIHVLPTMKKIVARTSNRAFVGLPVCRNDDYLNLMIKFTASIVADRARMALLSESLRGIVGACMSDARRTLRNTVPYLEPVIQERLVQMGQFGNDWADKPNDLLQWIIETAVQRKASVYDMVGRIQLIGFAAIHTSSDGITHALYHIAASPEYVQPLRDEIEPIIATEGWTKAGLSKMWKVDSFLRESQRVNGIGFLSLHRKVLKDITLPDGTMIPSGTLICAASHPTHHDEGIYDAPDTFDPWRFARVRESVDESGRFQLVNTSVNYLPFGHGKLSCPGRFFAASELKALLAFLVLNYDIKLAEGTDRPENAYFAEHILPNQEARLLFKRRE